MNASTTAITPEQKRILIAQACGWAWVEDIRERYWNAFWERGKEKLIPRGEDLTTRRRNRPDWLPDYLNDLNATAEMEKSAPMGYGDEVRAVVARDAGVAPQHICDQYVICATAAQRAEAFGRIMHLWP